MEKLFYASCENADGQKCLLAGPYETKKEAEAVLPECRQILKEKEVCTAFWSFGWACIKKEYSGKWNGKLNQYLKEGSISNV